MTKKEMLEKISIYEKLRNRAIYGNDENIVKDYDSLISLYRNAINERKRRKEGHMQINRGTRKRNIDIFVLRKEGLTFKEIAERYNLSNSRVREIFTKCNLEFSRTFKVYAK